MPNLNPKELAQDLDDITAAATEPGDQVGTVTPIPTKFLPLLAAALRLAEAVDLEQAESGSPMGDSTVIALAAYRAARSQP